MSDYSSFEPDRTLTADTRELWIFSTDELFEEILSRYTTCILILDRPATLDDTNQNASFQVMTLGDDYPQIYKTLTYAASRVASAANEPPPA